MTILKEADFRRQIKNPAPGYLFFGEEDYLKAQPQGFAQHDMRRGGDGRA